MQRPIHPPAFGFHFFEDPLGFPFEGLHIHRRVVVIGDESGCWREIVKHSPT